MPGKVQQVCCLSFGLIQKKQKIKAVRNLPKTTAAHPLPAKLAAY